MNVKAVLPWIIRSIGACSLCFVSLLGHGQIVSDKAFPSLEPPLCRPLSLSDSWGDSSHTMILSVKPHTQIECDPIVWEHVEFLIRENLPLMEPSSRKSEK